MNRTPLSILNYKDIMELSNISRSPAQKLLTDIKRDMNLKKVTFDAYCRYLGFYLDLDKTKSTQ